MHMQEELVNEEPIDVYINSGGSQPRSLRNAASSVELIRRRGSVEPYLSS